MRGGVADDVLGRDLLAVGKADARDVAVLRDDVLDLGVIPDLAALFEDGVRKGAAYAVGAVLRHLGAEADVEPDHEGIVQEAELVLGRAEIGPVDVENLLRLLGHLDGVEHLVDGVGGDAHEVGVLALEHGGVRVAARLGEVAHGPAALAGELEEGGGGFAAAGDVALHLVDEVLNAEGHGVVLPGAQGDAAVGLGDGHELYLVEDAELLEEVVEVATVAGGAHVAELVERGLELEAPADETCGEAAG